jgi:hypothetical protein
MAEPKVWVFFYGSFINRQVLARGGLVPRDLARLGPIDMRAQAKVHSARRADTPPSAVASGALAARSG